MRKLVLGLVILVGVLLAYGDNPHGPTVVAQVDTLAGSADISTTTLVSPTVDTNYLVAVNVDVHGTGTTSIDCTIFYLSRLGSQNQGTVNVNATSGLVVNTVQNIVAVAGTPVTYSCHYSPGSTGDVYDASISLLKL